MYYQIIIIFHVLFGLGVIGLVLMQQGKGADAGAAFGSGSSGSVFGAQGAATFLSKSTAIFACLFFVTSLSLAWLSGQQNKDADIMDIPEIEGFKADVPLVDGEPLVTEESVPVITSSEEVPVELINEIQDGIKSVVEQTESVVEEAEQVFSDSVNQNEVVIDVPASE